MSTIRFIRTNLFHMSQSDFAAMINRTQASVSRWESGGPFTNEDMSAIREAGIAKGLAWDDRLFFEPATAETRS